MPLEQKEQYRLTKELLDKRKDSRLSSEPKRLKNYSMLGFSNKWKSRRCWRNRPERKKHSSSQQFENRDKSDNFSKS